MEEATGVHVGPETYQEIKALLSIKIHDDWRDDEPIFIVRAQDSESVKLLDEYIKLQTREGNDPSFMDHLRRIRNAFEDWQIRYPDCVKDAD